MNRLISIFCTILQVFLNTRFSRNFKSCRVVYYFFGFGGFNDGVFPGVSLLSLARLSGFPVDLAILFGPGLSAIIFCLKLILKIYDNF